MPMYYRHLSDGFWLEGFASTFALSLVNIMGSCAWTVDFYSSSASPLAGALAASSLVTKV